MAGEIKLTEEFLAEYRQTLKDAGLEGLSRLTSGEDISRLALVVNTYKSGNNPRYTADDPDIVGSSTMDDINDMVTYFKAPVTEAKAKENEKMQSLYHNHTFWRQYNKDKKTWNFSSDVEASPHNAMCGIIIDKMYGSLVEGKSMSQLADMYPSKDGKGYFEALNENLHKNIDPYIQEAVNREDNLNEELFNSSHAIEEEEVDEEIEEELEDEGPELEENSAPVNDNAFFGGFNSGARANLFDSEPEIEEEPVIGESMPPIPEVEERAMPLEREIADFNQKGIFPSQLDAKAIQSGLENAVKETNTAYADKVAPQNLPAPIALSDDGVTAHNDIAVRIAADARAKLMLAGGTNDICDTYEKMVEAQMSRIIAESDYEKKCEEGCLFKEDLANDIQAFKDGSDKLPYFIDHDMINRATANALKYVRDQYPLNTFSAFDPELSYDTDKPALVKPSDEYVLEKDGEIPDNISYINDTPDYIVNHGDEISQRTKDLGAIKALNYKALTIESMAPAVRMFDKFMENNPQLGKCIKAPYVSGEYKKTSVGKDGKTTEAEADPTDLFYIEGKSVDKYLSGKIKNYNNYSPKEKQYVAKVAIMNAMATGKAVDVKNYVQDPKDKSYHVKISNVTLRKPETILGNSKDAQKARAKQLKDEQAAKKRADSILKMDKAKDDKILGNLNRYCKNRAETLHSVYVQKTKEGLKAEADRRIELGFDRGNMQDLLRGEFKKHNTRTTSVSTSQTKNDPNLKF